MIFTTALTTVFTALAMVAVKFLFPLQNADDGPSLEDLELEYKRWSIAGVPLFIVSIAGAGAATYFGLMSIAGSTVVDLPNEVWLRPAPAVYGCAALALGFALGTLITFLIFWVLLGERFPEYCRYDELSSGYSTIRCIAWLCTFLCGCGILLALAASTGKWVLHHNRSASTGARHSDQPPTTITM